ncbi:TatD family nuclease-associated radical SAM protein [Candidatus Bathyarchaeota archaeon]|nr:TatD family nuclease-associated radical SAM protein [Candidatus Bathyarchaeota archaeon]
MATKKKPSVAYWLENTLYLNITNRCHNNCYFCLRNFRDGIGSFNLKLNKEPAISEVLTELQEVLNLKNWREIVFCGFGEPLERLDCVLEVSNWIKRNHGKMTALRIDTNGQGFLLNRGRNVINELKTAGIDKLSVSLNAHDKKTYMEVCRPSFENAFESILEFVEKAKEEALDVEVTAVTIPEVDLKKVGEIAEKLGARFRTRAYIPGFW